MNPNTLAITSENEISKTKFYKLLEKLVYLQHLTTKVGDEAKEQFGKLIDQVVSKHRDEFAAFDKFNDRLDSFMMQYLLDEKYNSLAKVYILIFCLSHGQSAIERGFNANKQYIADNQAADSLISLRIIHDHLKSNKITSKLNYCCHN